MAYSVYPLLASLADLIVCHVCLEAMDEVKRGCLTSIKIAIFYSLFKIAPSAVLTSTHCRRRSNTWAVYRPDAATADRAYLATTCMTCVGAALMMGEESLSGAGCVSCTFSVIATIRRFMIGGTRARALVRYLLGPRVGQGSARGWEAS